MINKRLFRLTKGARKWLFISVLNSYLSAVFYMASMLLFALLLQSILMGQTALWHVLFALPVLLALLFARMQTNGHMVAAAARYSNAARSMLRRRLYEKVSEQEIRDRGSFSASELAQTAAGGIDQLSAYFGRYIPQVFSTMLIPPTILLVLGVFNWVVALVLVLCVPLIPLSILVIRKLAKGQSRKYWRAYVSLGERFLENIRGLTTLKVFQMDETIHREMNQNAERFRTSIMQVLRGQLNSITVMDFIVYGGSGAGIAAGLIQASQGNLNLVGLILVLLLSTEFFLPLRYLGSLFHVAMTGVSAAERLFQFLDLPEEQYGEQKLSATSSYRIEAHELSFSYDGTRPILQSIDFEAQTGERIALVGQSGSGKSTLQRLVSGLLRGYKGSLTINGNEWRDLDPDSVFQQVGLMSSDSRLFTATLRENLRFGNPNAEDAALIAALERVNLRSFFDTLSGGLDTVLTENGGNLSGGQKQRLIMARLLLADRSIYLFDEATSNVDADSEEIMLDVMRALAQEKLVIVIAHRMYSIRDADRIYVLDRGAMVQSGTHETLISEEGAYKRLVEEEEKMEKGVCADEKNELGSH
ncbi:ABC transporter ATP-binding protein/permease [Sporolactobacillus shoreicorticis]|uniref:ABC transporter ATP-binding protein/permease n=1 Tax=Sporolactobacillus shoreicorticis TaxID=1923877 RepID=A0ABW5S592_9BACL|nr:ABC transporter ATP-binding protein/permease [Sporolactobacillus shoreicorticis]MCO7127549.1 ABC transporter ATP-binding protein/permease [Sporolactobacillus shoreicorticis]